MTNQPSTSLKSINLSEKVETMRSTCERILSLAEDKGATSAQVGVSQDTGIGIQVRDGDVETVEFNQDSSFGISVFIGHQKGTASTTDTSEAAINEAVEKACNIARYTSPDPFSGLADKSLMAQNIQDLKLDHPSDLPMERMIELCLKCEESGLSADKRVKKSDGVGMSAHRFARVYANSHGFIGSNTSTRYSMSNVLIAEDAKGMQRNHWYTLSRELEKLESPESVGRRAAERVVSHLGARPMKTCKAPVMMTPEVARGLFSHFFSAIQGGSLYRNASFLVDSIGQTVFPEFITINERPHIVGGLASTYFDSEGVATKDRDIVKDGKLEGYVLSSYSARKLGLETTGNAGGLHNVFISHSDKDYEAMLKELGTGLLVTDVMGQGVNIVTGDYSRGASGFWVENGKIQFPVNEITIAGNLKSMFQNVRILGNDLDLRSPVVCGSMIIDGMTIAGNE
ncbi:metalloprotease PmbA [Pleionea sediminis]|uniref:metalloprotease PmbA n=1 Tax=Pleionea sediminis TaxID=2569479 RepID=UPI001FEB05F9|nr:metalloprotease PmbA [Pleionea sediminis]